MNDAARQFNIPEIKERANLADIARAAGVDLKRKHGEWVACCPFHTENSPSFTIYDKGNHGKFKCFGCGEGGDVIKFVELAYKMSTKEALEFLSGKTGADVLPVTAGVRGDRAARLAADARKAKWKKDNALGLWDQGSKWHPTVTAYLKARGIDVAALGGMPASLRFHPQVLYKETGERMPAMLAPIVNKNREIVAVHRTYLKVDGSGKADVEKAKMVLGNFGGGYIPLIAATEHLNIAEGIETALSARLLGATGGLWSCVSLSNLQNLIIPPQVTQITILADNDMKDPEPGKPDLRVKIKEAAYILQRQRPGRKVFINWPPKGQDFNDVLVAKLAGAAA